MAGPPNIVVLDLLNIRPDPFKQFGCFFGINLDKLLATAQVILQSEELGLNMAV